MPPSDRRLESLGLAVAVVATIDSWAMLAQGASGFTLPSSPLLVLQGLTMGLLLLLPLYVPRAAPAGLDRLPPQAQVRGGWQVLAVTLLGVPLLLGAVVLRRSTEGYLVPDLVGVLVLVLILTAVRQLLANRETRRLYAVVATAADERRRLLSDVMRSLDEDRHRVASQLHDQAISSYAAFASLAQTAAGSGRSTVLAGASGQLRDNLAGQAESLRRLMLAVRPLEAHGSTERRLVAPITAYVDSLWGDTTPSLHVEVDPDLRLDWTNETLALRIVQEAIGNAWRHASARSIDVRFDVVDGQLEVTISDDGVGFDVATSRSESSGLTTMRSFAALSGGELTVHSRRWEGTRVVARLGVGPANGATPPPTPMPGGPGVDGSRFDGPRLRIVPDA
jgi:signal transduction histidine kinase